MVILDVFNDPRRPLSSMEPFTGPQRASWVDLPRFECETPLNIVTSDTGGLFGYRFLKLNKNVSLFGGLL